MLDKFLTGKNVKVSGEIAGRRHILRTLNMPTLNKTYLFIYVDLHWLHNAVPGISLYSNYNWNRIDSISQIAWQNWLKILNHRSQDKTNVSYRSMSQTYLYLLKSLLQVTEFQMMLINLLVNANFILQTSGVIIAGLGLAAIGFGGKANYLVYF